MTARKIKLMGLCLIAALFLGLGMTIIGVGFGYLYQMACWFIEHTNTNILRYGVATFFLGAIVLIPTALVLDKMHLLKWSNDSE